MNFRVAARPSEKGCAFYVGTERGTSLGTLLELSGEWSFALAGQGPKRPRRTADEALKQLFCAGDRAEILDLVAEAIVAVDEGRRAMGADPFVVLASETHANPEAA